MSDFNPYQAPSVIDSAAPGPIAWRSGEFKSVERGLYIVYYGIVAILGAMVLLPLLAAVSGAAGLPALAGVGILGMIFIIFCGGVAIFIGQLFCLAVPVETGAKNLITAAVVMQSLTILFSIVAFFLGIAASFSGRADAVAGSFLVGQGLNFLNGLLGFASFICFVLFLRRVNLTIQRVDLAGSAKTILVMMVVMMFVCIGMVGAVIAVGVAGGPMQGPSGPLVAVMVMGLVVMLVGLILFVKYANLVVYTAKALGALLETPPQESSFHESPVQPMILD